MSKTTADFNNKVAEYVGKAVESRTSNWLGNKLPSKRTLGRIEASCGIGTGNALQTTEARLLAGSDIRNAISFLAMNSLISSLGNKLRGELFVDDFEEFHLPRQETKKRVYQDRPLDQRRGCILTNLRFIERERQRREAKEATALAVVQRRVARQARAQQPLQQRVRRAPRRENNEVDDPPLILRLQL